MEDHITLADFEIEFLQDKFKVSDPNKAVERTIEFMVFSGLDPMNLKQFVEQMIKRYQC